MSELEDIRFQCHYGWNYAASGNDQPLPSGYFWWGWDYAHGGDVNIPAEAFPAEIQELMERRLTAGRNAKDWTCDEVREHVLDALMELRSAIQQNAALATTLLPNPLPRA